MTVNLYEDWLNDELKEEIVNLFQSSYGHELTETEIANIANTLANTAELWIKFTWRISNGK